MVTKVVNLYGGPGTGKSTSASMLFALLKEYGEDVEIVTEYVKQWAWEDRKPVNYDQFYLFGKQSRREYSLFGKLRWIITDAPTALCGYYASVFGTQEQAKCFENMTKTYYDMCKNDGVQHIHAFIKRVKPYNPNGRFQNEEEARKIDIDMLCYLHNLGFEFHHINGDRQGVEDFFRRVMKEDEGQ